MPDRSELISQLEYLLSEIASLEDAIASVPDEILAVRPVSEQRSIKELYGLIASYDDHVYRPLLEKISAGGSGEVHPPDDDKLLADSNWNEAPFEAILDSIKDVRRELIALVEALPASAWSPTSRAPAKATVVTRTVLSIVHHDTEILREAAHRFYEMRFGSGQV